jgi:hypothetical protein
MHLSPELELLEQLTGGDIPLGIASKLFPDTERFLNVVDIFLRSQSVRVIRTESDNERFVQPWELRLLLEIPEAWAQRPGQPAEYRLQLTAEGYKQFASDSQGFFDQLFGR